MRLKYIVIFNSKASLMLRVVIFVVLFVAHLSFVHAADERVSGLSIQWVESGWGGEGLYIGAVNSSGANVSYQAASGATCVGRYYLPKSGTAMFSENVSIALMAQAAGKKVDLIAFDCTGTSNIRIKAIRVSN